MVIGGDNGGMPMEAGNNFPLRGHKAELWEGGVRNNALVWSRNLIPAAMKGGLYSGGLVHVMDWHGKRSTDMGVDVQGRHGVCVLVYFVYVCVCVSVHLLHTES